MRIHDNFTLTESDIKQISLIKQYTELFSDQKIDIFDFTSKLVGLLNALETINPEWKEKIQTEINTLEMVHDSIADNSIVLWNDSPNEVIEESISNLNKAAEDILQNYLMQSDPTILETAITLNGQWYMCPICTDSWRSESYTPMILCPKCDHVLHNPQQI